MSDFQRRRSCSTAGSLAIESRARRRSDSASRSPKDAPIVVYCASDTCMNSHQAAERLAAQGYSNVYVYAGGKKDWQQAGLKLEK